MESKPKYTPFEIAVVQYVDKYYFWDEPIWGEDMEREECVAILNRQNETGYHMCNKSAVWDDMEGYTDEIQQEESLPDGLYIVCYFWFDGQDILQLCDYGITKQQIVDNVRNQKYREGADYFMIEGSNKP